MPASTLIISHPLPPTQAAMNYEALKRVLEAAKEHAKNKIRLLKEAEFSVTSCREYLDGMRTAGGIMEDDAEDKAQADIVKAEREVPVAAEEAKAARDALATAKAAVAAARVAARTPTAPPAAAPMLAAPAAAAPMLAAPAAAAPQAAAPMLAAPVPTHDDVITATAILRRAKAAVISMEQALVSARAKAAAAEAATKEARRNRNDAITALKAQRDYLNKGHTIVDTDYVQLVENDVPKTQAKLKQAKEDEKTAAEAVQPAEAAHEEARDAEAAAVAALGRARAIEKEAKHAATIAAGNARRAQEREAERARREEARHALPRADTPPVVRFLMDEAERRRRIAFDKFPGDAYRESFHVWALTHAPAAVGTSDKALTTAFEEYGVHAARTNSDRFYNITWAEVRAKISAAFPIAFPPVVVPPPPPPRMPDGVREWLAARYIATGDPADAIGSKTLLEAFIADTGIVMTLQTFGGEMTMAHGETKDKKKRTKAGWVYIGLRRIV